MADMFGYSGKEFKVVKADNGFIVYAGGSTLVFTRMAQVFKAMEEYYTPKKTD